ncbi:MAG: slipin family protein [Alphaproteobacteria bacterium]|nr:slipin family protein [Alphaproteobacteria bacterium]USO07447.1 MAG: slipin family protein [Rhodospirillales bacterium]
MIQLFIIILFALALFVATSVRIMREYERAVIFTLGRYTHTAGPGLIILIPFIQSMVRVDIRVRTQDVPSQDVISKDNVSVRVSAVVYYRVVDPSSAIIKVEDFMQATSEVAQTTLRSILGKHELDDMLSNRDQLNADLQGILDTTTEGWGVKVTQVAIKHVDIDPSMIRAIARQAEAERERRAKIINAEGELQAAKQLDEAATILAQRPESMQLRYLSALTDIAGDKTNTIVMPLPDLVSAMMAKKA